MSSTPNTALIAGNLTIYSLTHALVDAACAALVFTIPRQHQIPVSDLYNLIILYNLLAFGLQSPLGILIDNLRIPRASAAAGCLITALAVIAINPSPLLAVCLAGVGNALFHIGGGAISLSLQPGRAALPGVFVAPGAVGLLLGTLIGKSGSVDLMLFTALLTAAAAAIYLMKPAPISVPANHSSPTNSHFGLILLLILAAVAFRSFIGLLLVFPWKTSPYLLASLTLAVVLGKGLGGLLGDRFGWIRVSVTGLIISAPLIAMYPEHPQLAIPGMLLFNLTMPITLAATADTLPDRPGFAFGLTTLALLVGALLQFFGLGIDFSQSTILILVLLSALLLLIGLRFYSLKQNPSRQSTTNISCLESAGGP